MSSKYILPINSNQLLNLCVSPFLERFCKTGTILTGCFRATSVFKSAMQNSRIEGSQQEFSEEKKRVLAQIGELEWNSSMLGYEWKSDRDVAVAFALASPLEFAWADFNDEFRKDKELARRILPFQGLAIDFFDEEVKKDEELVEIAVTNDGLAIRDVNEYFGNNKRIALIAVSQNPDAFDHLDEKLKKDKDIIIAVLFHNRFICCLGVSWRKNYEVAIGLIVATKNLGVEDHRLHLIAFIDHSLFVCQQFVVEADYASENFTCQIKVLPLDIQEQIMGHLENAKKNPQKSARTALVE